MRNITAKSTLRVENDPELSNLTANQVCKLLEYPQPVVGLEPLRKWVHVVQSQIHPLNYPNDLLLAGKMGRMNGQPKQSLETIQIALFIRLQLAKAGRPPAWQDSPANFDG